MDFGDFKLYNLCIERLKHQIARAKAARPDGGMAVLESYCTADPEEIIDILELYDLEERSMVAVMGKLEELASDASLFVGENIAFAFDASGDLCIYLVLSEQSDNKLDNARASDGAIIST